MSIDALTVSLTQLTVNASIKQRLGQFFTVNCDYILEGIHAPASTVPVIEPCVGQGHLVQWLRKKGYTGAVEAYDIELKTLIANTLDCKVAQRDTLMNPPDYGDKYVLSNPPYFARNKCVDKAPFDRYNANDLFKCYLVSFLSSNPLGGTLIIPASFFLSPRDVDLRVRRAFMQRYRVTRVNYFEQRVFPDAAVTVVAFSFERVAGAGPVVEQSVPWYLFPERSHRVFTMRDDQGWIIGGDIYQLPATVRVGRQVTGVPLKANEHLTRMLLRSMDSGTQEGRIALLFKDVDYRYESKPTSRSYAMLTVGRVLSADQQQDVCRRFNELLERRREETCSLCLPPFRESKEYARKRIPFELAYRLVSYLIGAG